MFAPPKEFMNRIAVGGGMMGNPNYYMDNHLAPPIPERFERRGNNPPMQGDRILGRDFTNLLEPRKRT